jgi:CDP-glucose 4,6-dehydratase
MTYLENPHADFWRGKRVLVTGHTGFKGAWLTLWLRRLGAQVIGVGLPPVTTPSLFELADIESISHSHFCDIRDLSSITHVIGEAEPDVVFHLAAQALVRHSYREPLVTFGTNIQGTANVLEALRAVDSVRAVVVITTDKVYRHLAEPYPFRETDPLGGHDPYSASKAAAEIVTSSYRDSFLGPRGVAVASARAGNAIGGGDWSDDRLIPDAVRAWGRHESLVIRRPQAVRPWQHVLEPLSGYLKLAERIWHQPSLAGAYNFGPETHDAGTVREVIQFALAAFNNEGGISWGDGSEGPHEAGWLALEVAKARTTLDYRPRWSLRLGVERTMKWYLLQLQGRDSRELCSDDIDAFEAMSPNVAAP